MITVIEEESDSVEANSGKLINANTVSHRIVHNCGMVD